MLNVNAKNTEEQIKTTDDSSDRNIIENTSEEENAERKNKN